MTYPEALNYLYKLRLFGTRLGLDRTRALAGAAGNPEACLSFIHVAGTNGKGSTCAMLESIYRAAGYRTGLFTSPHLASFTERIQVGRRPIPVADAARLIELLSALKPERGAGPPTFFEFITILGLLYFLEQECQIVIWETGMGGRLDATNIVMPLASVITTIGYDHTDVLGKTLREIAHEKAGIIKPGRPAITGVDQEEALSVLAARADELGVPLHIVPPGNAASSSRLDVGLRGEYQRHNAALAATTVRVVNQSEQARAAGLHAGEGAIAKGLQTVSWPGRFQIIRDGARTILLDGAHNPAGMETLSQSIRGEFPGADLVLILGILEDKGWAEMCETIAPCATRIVTTPVASDRTASPLDLAKACRVANPAARVTEAKSLLDALEQTARAQFLVITGSLYLVGEALKLLNVLPCPPGEEVPMQEMMAAKNIPTNSQS